MLRTFVLVVRSEVSCGMYNSFCPEMGCNPATLNCNQPDESVVLATITYGSCFFSEANTCCNLLALLPATANISKKTANKCMGDGMEAIQIIQEFIVACSRSQATCMNEINAFFGNLGIKDCDATDDTCCSGNQATDIAPQNNFCTPDFMIYGAKIEPLKGSQFATTGSVELENKNTGIIAGTGSMATLFSINTVELCYAYLVQHNLSLQRAMALIKPPNEIVNH